MLNFISTKPAIKPCWGNRGEVLEIFRASLEGAQRSWFQLVPRV